LAYHVDGFDRRASPVLPRFALLQPEFRVSTAGPVQYEYNFSATVIDVSHDLRDHVPATTPPIRSRPHSRGTLKIVKTKK
jgi:hypothetical protein